MIVYDRGIPVFSKEDQNKIVEYMYARLDAEAKQLLKLSMYYGQKLTVVRNVELAKMRILKEVELFGLPIGISSEKAVEILENGTDTARKAGD